MLGFIQYGSRLFGIDASSDSAKFQDDWLSESRLNVKFQNQKLAKNGEFDKLKSRIRHRHFSPFFAIFRHFSPLAPHYTLYIIHYTLYIIHYTLYIIHYTLYIIHYTLYIIHYTLYIIHYTLYILHNT